MDKIDFVVPEFVEFIPEDLAPGVLYISMKYGTASHLCACGCGNRVVTPLSRNGWQLLFDGTVTLSPSIGNFEFPCNSHYFIRGNRVVWADAEWILQRKSKKKERKKLRFVKHFPFLVLG